MAVKHECIYDICNFCGENGGAWADQYGDDVIVFGGMWHGTVEGSSGMDWLPGGRSVDLYTQEERNDWRERLGIEHAYFRDVVNFAVKGDITPIVKRFKADKMPRPKDFRDVVFVTVEEVLPLIEEAEKAEREA